MVAEPIKKTRPIGPAPKVDIKSASGSTRSISLDAEVFAQTPNVPLMHQVVNAQLAAKRSGTQSTKTRAEVSGGGAKPYRQKGTGRARQGSTRAPHFVGGGIAFGPKPRSYDQKTPKKMVAAALKSALSDRASENKIVVTDGYTFTPPKTKEAVEALAAWGVEGKVLLCLGDDDANAYMAFRNLQNVHVVHENELNVYDVLKSDYVVFTEDTLPGIKPEKTAVEAPARKKPAAKAAATEEATTEEEAN